MLPERAALTFGPPGRYGAAMFERVREILDQVRTWWDNIDPAAEENRSKVLTFFRPAEPTALPRPVQQVVAVGTLAAVLAFGGLALLSLSGLLFSLFVIYLLVTEVLGLEFDVDPRIWQAM